MVVSFFWNKLIFSPGEEARARRRADVRRELVAGLEDITKDNDEDGFESNLARRTDGWYLWPSPSFLLNMPASADNFAQLSFLISDWQFELPG